MGVFNIQGVDCLLKDNRLQVYPVYIACEDKLRLQRSLTREDHPNCEEICRRFLTDLKDFQNIPFDYITHYNGGNARPEDILTELRTHNILSKND